jgi:murein DD-endopeptidase MepM/ murein hydrolase activator NlpD
MDLTPGLGRRTRTITAIAGAMLFAVGSGVAVGGGGGLGAPETPSVKDASCVERCLALRTVVEGGRVQLTGRALGAVKTVRMPGADDIRARVKSDKLVEFIVPEGATSGAPIAIDAYGNRARSPVEIRVKDSSAISETGEVKMRETTATPRKSYFAAKKRSTVQYLFEASEAADVRIDVFRKDKLIDRYVEKSQEPYTHHEVSWNGLTPKGKVAPNGKYRFQVSPLTGGERGKAGFKYYDHRFPLPAKHSYGDGLGAGRNHQGLDIFAKCGKPVLAARGGRVQTVQYHSAAGYYVVIDGAKTGVDYAYMHLSKKGRPRKGQKVKTGERIGFNDETGNASGCHLHFEMWSAPGWYEGGRPMDPVPHMKKWDRWS